MGSLSDTLTFQCSLGGSFTATRTGDGRIQRRIAMPAGKASVVASVIATDAVLTLAVGHGITDADLVGIFWAGGQRVNLVVTAHDATSITVTTTSGEGDTFPAEDTVIVASAATINAEIAFVATTMQMLSVGCDAKAGEAFEIAASFRDVAPANLLRAAAAGGECYSWMARKIAGAGGGFANPITGTVTSLACYNGSITATDLIVGILLA